MSEPIENFRTILSRCASWHTMTGVTGTDEQKATAALAFIKRFGVKARQEPPRAFLTYGNLTRDKVSTNDYRPSGTIIFRLELAVPAGATDFDDEHSSIMDFANELSKELGSLSVSTGLIELASIQILSATRSSRTDPDAFWSLKCEARFPQ